MRRFLPAVVVSLGLALGLAGVLVFAAANRGPADFGWTSYAPLEPEGPYDTSVTFTFDDRWTVLWTGGHLAGGLLVVSALLVLTATGGWWLGRRGARRSAPGT